MARMSKLFSLLIPLPSLLLGLRARAEPLGFNRDVRPILADNCLGCHGSDKHQSGLRLDHREVATRPAKSGETAIMPGHPESSELVRRITSSDADQRMPPPESEHVLTAAQIQTLTQWIADGAAYQGHWAFTAPVRPAPPKVKDDRWPRNPIDQFVLSKLEASGLPPSPQADKVTLLRRLYLDLIRLPPT